MTFSLVVAADQNMGIGKNNTLPWSLPGDLRYFAAVTSEAAKGKRNAVIMGRKTWESIPEKHRPLKKRLNVVLSRNEDLELPDGVLLANSFEQALKQLDTRDDVDQVFVIGGANVFEQALQHPGCDKVYLTEVQAVFDCDTYFPKLSEQDFALLSRNGPHEDDGVQYYFAVYEKISLQ